MKIIFSAIVLTLSLLFLGHVFSQSTQLKENEQEFPFSKLTLEIATPKEAFAQIEPIPIVLTISNKTSRPIRGHTALDFSGNHVEVLVRRDYGEVYKVKQLSLLIEDIVATPRKLKPGEHYQSTQILTLDLENIFPYPSSYQIQVLFYNDDRKEKVKSNVLNIRIEQPEGINLQAIEYIKSKGNPAIFFTGSGLVGNEE